MKGIEDDSSIVEVGQNGGEERETLGGGKGRWGMESFESG